MISDCFFKKKKALYESIMIFFFFFEIPKTPSMEKGGKTDQENCFVHQSYLSQQSFFTFLLHRALQKIFEKHHPTVDEAIDEAIVHVYSLSSNVCFGEYVVY